MADSSPEPLVISYQIEQIYVELARAAAEMGVYKLYKNPVEPDKINEENNIRFAAVAISVVFAYSAIEASINAQLHMIFSQIQNLTEEERSAGFNYKFRDEKYRDGFKDEASWEKLCWSDMKNKLKALASALNIPPLHEKDGTLWQEILDISEDIRNFIIHPDPRSKEFQDKMQKIMEKHVAGVYAELASKTIRYFIEARGITSPEWLSKNLLFRFLNSNDIAHAWNGGASSK